ncbi:hypothetical protein [Pseudomonas sp. D(2018)]|uniref:hypothetical protein n=1 Tax=Pseudomonas sp. D(2018) TaxID=2502238 RepID=UPI001C498B58|nr:hypothetical protein [Pseudomonas sp. D(2018)]
MTVGWVKPAKPIAELMGFASLYPSYELEEAWPGTTVGWVEPAKPIAELMGIAPLYPSYKLEEA